MINKEAKGEIRERLSIQNYVNPKECESQKKVPLEIVSQIRKLKRVSKYRQNKTLSSTQTLL